MILDGVFPVVGVSSDGITSDEMVVVEVQCPTNLKSFRRYIKRDGTPAAQIQMLRDMARNKCNFSVLLTLTLKVIIIYKLQR